MSIPFDEDEQRMFARHHETLPHLRLSTTTSGVISSDSDMAQQAQARTVYK